MMGNEHCSGNVVTQQPSATDQGAAETLWLTCILFMPWFGGIKAKVWG